MGKSLLSFNVRGGADNAPIDLIRRMGGCAREPPARP